MNESPTNTITPLLASIVQVKKSRNEDNIENILSRVFSVAWFHVYCFQTLVKSKRKHRQQTFQRLGRVSESTDDEMGERLTAEADPAESGDLVLLLHEVLGFLGKEVLNQEVDQSSVDEKTRRAR